MNRLLDWISKGVTGILDVDLRGMPLIIIYFFLFLLLLCLILYIGAWCYIWYCEGTAQLAALNQFISTIVSAPFMAAVGFFARKVIDKNNDGIPDEDEVRLWDKK